MWNNGLSRACVIGAMLIFSSITNSVSAAESCERAFQDSDGLNPDLEDTPNELDIPDSVWGNDPWPNADEMPLDGVYRLEEIELEKGYDITVKEGGRAIIFVNGDLEIDQTETLWNVNGTPDQLIVIVRGEVETGNQFTFNGILYAEDDIEFGNNFVGSGMISSREEIELGKGKTDISGLDGKWADGLFIPGVCGFDGGCVASFPDGISSYNGGTINFGENAKLVNAADGALAAGSISKNGGSTEATCDTADCQLSSEEVEPLSLPPFPAINPPDGGDIYVGYQDEQTVGGSGNRFGRVGTNSEAVLNFSGANATYYIEELNLGYRVELNLPAGDYYINRMFVNSQVRVNVIGAGTARLFVNNSVQLGSPSFFNSPGVDQSGDPSKLMLISYSDVSFNSQATLSGAVYALGDINLGSPAYLYGAATASKVTLNTNARIYYDAMGMSGIDYGDTCDAAGGQVVDHYRIFHPSQALTCTPAEQISVRACANSDCTDRFTEEVSVELAPEGGWLGGNVVSFEQDSGELFLRSTTPGTAQLGISTASVPATEGLKCFFVGGGGAQSNCEIEFLASGLIFDVPDLISHRSSGTVRMKAVREDDQTQACVPAFGDVDKVVQFSSAYLDPDSDNRDISRDVLVNGTSVSRDSNSPTGIQLSFDDEGVAEIDVSYLDAGAVQLSAVYVGSEETDEAGLIMPGVDNFIAVPAGFCVTSGGDCPAGDSSCPPFRKAGESFDLSIQAVGWQSDADSDFCIGNPTTPNFMLPDIPLQLELVEPNEVGAVPGTLPEGAESYVHRRSSDATEVVSLSQSEVGVFRFRTAPEPGAYLERDLPPAVSQPIGRFYPDRFRVTVEDGELGGECEPDAFVYTGQEFGWKLAASALIEPLSIQGEVTKNYTFDGFRRLFEDDITRSGPEELVALNNDDEPMKLGSDMKGAALTVSSPGQLEYRYHSEDKFWFEKTPAARRAPFYPEIQFALSDIEDGDGVRSELPRNDIRPEMPAEVRYGRLVMENVYGPENLERPAVLRMPFEVEVFDGDRFDRHSDDSCNSWSTVGIDVVEAPARHTLKPDSGTFVDGKGEPLSISPTGERGTDVLEWSVSTWLQDFWGRESENPGEPAEGELQNPRATATFGVYRGNDRIIYWREVPAN